MNTATSRALRLIALHPAVKDVRIVVDNGETDAVVEIDLITELPAAWRAAGESPAGVRAIEPVTMTFPPNYPFAAPIVTLRQDFNRSHPHINPGPANLPPQPCLVAGSVNELIQTRGIDGLIDQLAEWLDKAAMFALNNPQNGWEPVRRDSILDCAIIDGDAIRDLALYADGSRDVVTQFIFVNHEGQDHFRINHNSLEPCELVNAQISSTPYRQHAACGHSIGSIFWTTKEPNLIVDNYLPETVSNVGDLLDRAKSYGCEDLLRPKMHLFAHESERRRYFKVPYTITFLVRRPYTVIGTGSEIELCSYTIDLSLFKDISKFEMTPVRPCMLREQLSKSLLKRASGVPAENAPDPWTLIGCGSVGSKVALHLARQGQGPDTVIDRSYISPHNYARHALTPDLTSIQGFADQKADLLATELKKFKQETAVLIATEN